MGVARCRECGKDVSTEAKTCPNCGKPKPVPGAAMRALNSGWAWIRGQSRTTQVVIVAVLLLPALIESIQKSQQPNAAGMSRADQCASSCQWLTKEKPRTDYERTLDQVSQDGYKACVERESGNSGPVRTDRDMTAMVGGMKVCKTAGVEACVASCTGVSAATAKPEAPARAPEPTVEYPAGWPRAAANAVFIDCKERYLFETRGAASKAEYVRYCNCVLRATASLFPVAFAEANPEGVVRQNQGAFARCSQ